MIPRSGLFHDNVYAELVAIHGENTSSSVFRDQKSLIKWDSNETR